MRNNSNNEITEDSIVETGYKLQATYNGQAYNYDFTVRGDIKGDGKVTLVDLTMINQAIVKKS